MQLQIEQFKSILQESASTMETYFKNLISKDYTLRLIENIREYSLSVKKSITEQYNSLNDEIRESLLNKYNEIVSIFDEMTKMAIEQANLNHRLLSLSNDVFYNDVLYLHPDKEKEGIL